MNLNREALRDQIYACWVGKSIGGTLGTPYEGRQELLDVTGFASAPGRPLPNDDLDLQLVWLHALEVYGPRGIDEKRLGELWLSFIPPHWNEYGICKANMRAGLLPPLSGAYNNPWKNSNGAWIRSEIWACCTPGAPALAAGYATSDACVDHGISEGTYAEIFTAVVESAAFVEKSSEKLIETGLSYLPVDCRVAKCIHTVLDGYRNGLGWQKVRQSVLDETQDLGWFQAPANIAFMVIGWLYGGGDFKKSLLIAVNCGDDTDCTAATLGSILGILGGMQVIPQDWRAHVGDEIISVAVDRGSMYRLPATCAELADRVLRQTEQVLAAFDTGITVSEAVTDLEHLSYEQLLADDAQKAKIQALTDAVWYDFAHTQVWISYPDGLDAPSGEPVSIELTLLNMTENQQYFDVDFILPAGFTLQSGPRRVMLMTQTLCTNKEQRCRFVLRAGEAVQGINRGILRLTPQGRPTDVLVPFLFFGRDADRTQESASE